MVKYNYFESLEKLSELCFSAVSLVCGRASEKDTDLARLRLSCDRHICELEDALFSDFLPPLERDSIAACAHSLSRIVDQASDLYGHTAPIPSAAKINEEGKICIQLAESLQTSICMLKRIRKPDELPDMQGFRKLLCQGRSAHNAMLTKLHAGTIPRSYAHVIILTGRLRSELSCAFDQLVEVMLNNI